MARRKRKTPARRRKQRSAVVSKGRWVHFNQLAAERGWPLEDGERVVAALAVPREAFSDDSSTRPEE